jgi:hypothetical protein
MPRSPKKQRQKNLSPKRLAANISPKQKALQRNLESLQFASPSKTRGWKILSPQNGKQRKAIHKKCGDSAFLMPKQEKFPIVSKDTQDCKPSCQGLYSAKSRAKQWGYDDVAARAERLIKKHC